MTEVYEAVDAKPSTRAEPELRGHWTFDTPGEPGSRDLSGRTGPLSAVGAPRRIGFSGPEGAVEFDGETQSLGASAAALRTDRSYTVAAWVRLDKDRAELQPGNFAFTAVSQDSPTHSAFYLGARAFEEAQPDGSMRLTLRWNFTVSPVDGSVTGVLEWRHASSSRPISPDMLDRWVLLVGVCDVEQRVFTLHVPSLDDGGVDRPPPAWTFWQADGGFQIGRALWLGGDVDQWPGAVGPVRAYAGAMTAAEVQRLYAAGGPA